MNNKEMLNSQMVGGEDREVSEVNTTTFFQQIAEILHNKINDLTLTDIKEFIKDRNDRRKLSRKEENMLMKLQYGKDI